jgi:hypothetical protein
LITIVPKVKARLPILLATPQKVLFMTVRRRWNRNFLTRASWLFFVALFCLSGRCIGQTYDGFGYSVSGTNISITSYTYPGGAVTIPSSIPGVSGSVTSIGDFAFENCTRLTGLTIPSSVTSIGFQAFCGCAGLTNAAIGGSVGSIGDFAFELCSSLTSLTIPGSVTNLGAGAFAFCSGLTSVTIPGSVANIGWYAFQNCSSLTSAFFRGNAPSAFGFDVFASTAPGFSIYYPSTAAGWTTPTWNGYPAQPYPLLGLVLASGAVTPSFNYLLVGTNYQLQVSTDLSAWSNTGLVFTATNASAAYPQPFNVGSSPQLFFRLVSVSAP